MMNESDVLMDKNVYTSEDYSKIKERNIYRYMNSSRSSVAMQ